MSRKQDSPVVVIIGLVVFFGLALFTLYTQYTEKEDTSNPLPAVHGSSLDGSVAQVEVYLKHHLKDPDSYQGISWGEVVKMPNGDYTVTHRYRARNSFGGYVVEERTFVLDHSGNVISDGDDQSN